MPAKHHAAKYHAVKKTHVGKVKHGKAAKRLVKPVHKTFG